MWVLVPPTPSSFSILPITSFLSSWDSATSTTANRSGSPQHALAILTPGRLAICGATSRLARSRCNDDVGSHDLPPAAPFDCSCSLQSRQWRDHGTASRRAPKDRLISELQITYLPLLIQPNASS